MEDIRGMHASLSIEHPEMLQKIAHALSSPVRLEIMRALDARSMNVGEIAAELGIPMSSAALAVKVLEEAGLITAESQPGVRGSMKLCSRKIERISIDLVRPISAEASYLTLHMPIGGYSLAEGICTTCGLAGEAAYIGEWDMPAAFYLPERTQAQMLWFRQGMLEYRFTAVDLCKVTPDWLELSFEACSEAPMFRDPWKSDISVEINGRRIGVWTCPKDCGGRHGALTPAWWSEVATQFGFLKTWRVDHTGSNLDGERISDVTLDELRIEKGDYIAVRIGVAEDAQNVGGLNLFGEKFGDYSQPIVARIGYHI